MKKIISLISVLLSFSVQAKNDKTTEIAIFSGGCFWCMEKPFDDITGVLRTTPGYTGGFLENPSYEQVSQGSTGHYEAIQISYDPSVVSYQELLDVFWKNIDPTNGTGQFCDTGPQYRSVIFYTDEQQHELAVKSKAQLEQQYSSLSPVRTSIQPASQFYVAEKIHQDYYIHHPWTYRFYRFTCGRDQRLEELWG